MKILHFLTFFVLFSGFLSAQNCSVNKDSVKSIIINTEKQFNLDLNKFGAQYAFEKYADENAVINRGKDSLIYGKKGIEHYYSKPIYKTATAYWKPDFVEISDDGTIAYTYGKYEWTFVNEKDEKTTYHGIFHTVWKRNEDGNWYYVWD